MKFYTRLLREPLLHFLLIGGLIFLFYMKLTGAGPGQEPADTVVIGPERIEQLAAGFEGVWRRRPNDDELRTLVAGFVREEIYYREALALGLDRDDTIVRRRLRQKMEFLSDTGADLMEPTTDELKTYLAANEQLFKREPRLAFEQVFLGDSVLPERTDAALNAMHINPDGDTSKWAERSLLPTRLGLSLPGAIDGIFGKGFSERLERVPLGEWFGPVESSFGMHLVRINDSVPARLPPLDEVRDAVLWDWKSAKAIELRELHFARIRERYVVKMPETGVRVPESR